MRRDSCRFALVCLVEAMVRSWCDKLPYKMKRKVVQSAGRAVKKKDSHIGWPLIKWKSIKWKSISKSVT